MINNISIKICLGLCIVIYGALLLTRVLSKPEPEKTILSYNTPATIGQPEVKSNKVTVKTLNIDPNRVIFFTAEVNNESVEQAIGQIETLSKSNKDIYLILDSPGGSVFDGIRLLNYMDGSKVHINTICYAMCASMAAQIHAHGSSRYSLAGATLMYHQASGGFQGSLKEMESEFTYVKSVTKSLDAYIADRAGIPPKVFDTMVEHELYMSGLDAVAHGLVDNVVVFHYTNDDKPFLIQNTLKFGFSKEKQIDNPLKNIILE